MLDIDMSVVSKSRKKLREVTSNDRQINRGRREVSFEAKGKTRLPPSEAGKVAT